MKIAIIGAAGVRTPLIVQAILKRQARLGITELSLLDIDSERLELIGALTSQLEATGEKRFKISRTTKPQEALAKADFVITTFRVGGIESRVVDERVPLNHGILGQETTGPGGFAMGMRSIPVILDYVHIMQEVCPDAWLINFANPAGMLTEAVIRNTDWRRAVGICDAPTAMHRVISAVMKANPNEVYLDYFGLNHLGWIRKVIYHQHDALPELLQMLEQARKVPGLPFETRFIRSLGMVPNEYLYYYYYPAQAIAHILAASECRGEQIARHNRTLFSELEEKFRLKKFDQMLQVYLRYLNERSKTYMVTETGNINDLSTFKVGEMEDILDEGYAGVALNLIEALSGNQACIQILNVPNHGSMNAMDARDVVEVPTLVSHDLLQPMVVGAIPDHCLGLVKQVKAYEHLTIEAAVEGSYSKAHLSLTIHPLVRDSVLANSILDEYIAKHQGYFPSLQ